jgi:hypothetical protein
MNKLIKLLVTGALFATIFVAAESQAAVRLYVRFAPPVKKVTVVKPVRPYRNALWISGHWKYTGSRHVWVKGYWVKKRPGYVYVQGSWKNTPRGYFYKPGHWRRVR